MIEIQLSDSSWGPGGVVLVVLFALAMARFIYILGKGAAEEMAARRSADKSGGVLFIRASRKTAKLNIKLNIGTLIVISNRADAAIVQSGGRTSAADKDAITKAQMALARDIVVALSNGVSAQEIEAELITPALNRPDISEGACLGLRHVWKSVMEQMAKAQTSEPGADAAPQAKQDGCSPDTSTTATGNQGPMSPVEYDEYITGRVNLLQPEIAKHKLPVPFEVMSRMMIDEIFKVAIPARLSAAVRACETYKQMLADATARLGGECPADLPERTVRITIARHVVELLQHRSLVSDMPEDAGSAEKQMDAAPLAKSDYGAPPGKFDRRSP